MAICLTLVKFHSRRLGAPSISTWLTLIPTWISNYTHHKKCGMKWFTHSQTSTVQSLTFGNGLISSQIYWVFDCLSMLGLKLIHVSESGPWWCFILTYLWLGPEYSRKIWSIPWLLMHWLLSLPEYYFKESYKLLILRALKCSTLNLHIF